MLRRICLFFLAVGLMAGCGPSLKETPKTNEVKKSPVVQNSAPRPRKVISLAVDVVTPQATSAPVLTAAEKSRRNEINIFKLNSQINTFKFKNNALPKDITEVRQAVNPVPAEVNSGKSDIYFEKNGKGGWYYNLKNGTFDLNP